MPGPLETYLQGINGIQGKEDLYLLMEPQSKERLASWWKIGGWNHNFQIDYQVGGRFTC